MRLNRSFFCFLHLLHASIINSAISTRNFDALLQPTRKVRDRGQELLGEYVREREVGVFEVVDVESSVCPGWRVPHHVAAQLGRQLERLPPSIRSQEPGLEGA